MFELFFALLRDVAHERLAAMEKAYIEQQREQYGDNRRIEQYPLSDRMDTFEL